MNWIIVVLIYLIGLEIVFMHTLTLDERTMILHGSLGRFNKFTSYLILCVFWPLTMWPLMLFRWLDVRDMSQAMQGRRVHGQTKSNGNCQRSDA